MVIVQTFDEIARKEFHVIEFCEIKNMRFREYGCGNIQRLTNLRQVLEKMRICQFFGVFVHVLFADSAACHQLCPNSHTGIIHENAKKVKRLKESFSIFFLKSGIIYER